MPRGSATNRRPSAFEFGDETSSEAARGPDRGDHPLRRAHIVKHRHISGSIAAQARQTIRETTRGHDQLEKNQTNVLLPSAICRSM
jgi:hypothetical protein